MIPAANTQPEPPDDDAGADYLRLSPAAFDLYIARHRAISAAEVSLAHLLDELASEMETECRACPQAPNFSRSLPGLQHGNDIADFMSTFGASHGNAKEKGQLSRL